MSLVDSREQRQRWVTRAQQLANSIEDLRRELTVAIRQKPTIYVMLKLGESDVHLAVAQTELVDAISRVELIG
jgi:hypothetical protein